MQKNLISSRGPGIFSYPWAIPMFSLGPHTCGVATGYHPVLRSTQGSQSQDAPKPGPTELSPEAATCSVYGNPHASPGIFSLLWGPPALSLQGQVSSHPMAPSHSHGDRGRQAGEGPPHRSRVETLQLGGKASDPRPSVFTHQHVPHTGVCPRAQ